MARKDSKSMGSRLSPTVEKGIDPPMMKIMCFPDFHTHKR